MTVSTMITEFDTSLPSVRQVQSLIKQGAPIEMKLLTGDILSGKVIWQDSQCICIVDESSQQITAWRQAVAYIKPMRS
jgi:host factor-I protein